MGPLRSRLRTPLGRRVVNWAAVLVWAGIIFYLSSLPKLGQLHRSLLIPKVAHVIEYAVLTFLLVRALATHGLALRYMLWIAAALALIYAASDELHQSFVPNRHSSLLDVLIDSVGIGVAAAVAHFWEQPATDDASPDYS
jgi:VanZ family protein